MLLTTILALTLVPRTLSKPFEDAPESGRSCGYSSCHATSPDQLNVHLVPHSHNDLGWRKTMDQYYYGTNSKQHEGVRGVQNILDTVVQSLKDDPDRRFMQVETANFARWWEEQSDDVKEIVKTLINNGQLEMVSGGWSMNDEATTNYQTIIDQLTLGLRFLRDELGDCAVPRVGWQIDSFGHSNTMATIFAQLGFDGVFLYRLDYRDYDNRLKTKSTELIWRGSADLAEDSDIFTSSIYRNYNAPDHFCWDLQCQDLPIIDDKDSFDYNLETRVEDFAKYINEQATKYQTNNILITMGGDFTFGAAHIYYANIDKLIKGFKEFKKDINIFYSTPSCYVKAVNDAAKLRDIKFALKTDDFIPYASDAHTYWSGFYSSRPTLKKLERLGNNLLQVARQLSVQANAYKKDFSADLTELKNVMGIMQHHDAITGTEKQHVSNDYTYLLTKAIEKAQKNVHTIIFDLLKIQKDDEAESLQLHSCLLSNVTRCLESNMMRFTVAVYNPNSHPVSDYIRLPVTSSSYIVQRLSGSVVPHQVAPSIDTFDDVPGARSFYDLTFYADNVPALGVHYFYVIKTDSDVNKPNLIAPKQEHILGNGTTGFSIDDKGFLTSVVIGGQSIKVRQEFLYYVSANGTNDKPENRASGAYVFRPLKGMAAVPISQEVACEVYRGALFDEVHQKFNDWLKQVIRVYKTENYIEFDWVVGPLEYIDDFGVEVISRFVTNINNNDVFYTDSNGRQLVKRVRNHRDTFQYTDDEPISGNYYPVTSRIVLKDEGQRQDFVIHTDRSQGGSSLESGQVELMIHRRLMNDDNFGVNEVLNEREFDRGVRVRGQHYLHFGDYETSAVQQRKLMQKTAQAPWVFVGDATQEQYSFNNMMRRMVFEFSGIRQPLPENVRILTLEQLDNATLLLRLEHMYGIAEHSELSAPVTLDLKELFTLYNVLSMEETTLGANQLKKDNQKLSWPAAPQQPRSEKQNETLTVALKPMEIKTFILKVEAIRIETYTGGSYKIIPSLFTIFLCVLYLLY